MKSTDPAPTLFPPSKNRQLEGAATVQMRVIATGMREGGGALEGEEGLPLRKDKSGWLCGTAVRTVHPWNPREQTVLYGRQGRKSVGKWDAKVRGDSRSKPSYCGAHSRG